MSSSAELQREREVQGYFQSWQIAQGSSLKVARNVDGITAPSQVNDAHAPQPSSDKALSAFAQLAVFRLNVKRAMVSLIDTSNQYILAEATRNLRLGTLEDDFGTDKADGNKKSPKINDHNSDLWLGTAILSRPEAVCEHCLHNTCVSRDPDGSTYTAAGLIVPDCRLDDRFKSRVYVQSEPGVRFYAGVPIYSRKGYMIGTYSVSDERPRSGLSIEDVKFMQSVAQAVTEHLEWARDRVDRFKGERIVRGLATFIEGCSSDDPTVSKDKQPRRPSIKRPPGMTITATRRSSLHNTMRKVDPDSAKMSQKAPSPPRKVKPQTDGLSRMYNRAADNLRSSILADGVVLFGSTASNLQHKSQTVETEHSNITGSDGLPTRVAADTDGFSTESSDSDTSPLSRPCRLLAYSLTDKSKPLDLEQGPSFSIGTLEKYFSLFPKGKAFTFTEDGNGISSDDDSASDGGAPADVPGKAGKHKRRNKEQMDHRELLKKIPGAKSVVFLPLFDYVEDKLVGGCFLWTSVPGRMMNLDEDLSYLRAFGNSITSQIGRINTKKNEAAKTTFIASMSHELRSPLHGILGAAEFLKDVVTDSYEAGLVNSIATCGKTLLDTLNHVLDFSKINNLGSGQIRRGSKHSKIISLSSDSMESLNMTASVDLSILVEEVVDAVATGHNFKKLPNRQGGQAGDAMMGGTNNQNASVPSIEHPVSVLLDISPRSSWMVKTQPGALRRIVMNLFGNALKYTSLGFVCVTVRAQELTEERKLEVLIRVTDTGKGMSEDFQQNRLFVPFSQEDSFQPGTGLGLSIVKQIVDSLGGILEVKSEQGKGTEIEARLRLEPSTEEDSSKPEEPMQSMREQLQGRSLVVLEATEAFHSSTLTEQVKVRNQALMDIFSGWFGITASKEIDTNPSEADFYLYCEPPSAKTLESRFEETATLGQRSKKTPIIIISLNEEEAAKISRAQTQALARLSDVVEVIPQPCGPRKLAQVFSRCLKRIEEGKTDDGGENLVRSDYTDNKTNQKKTSTADRESADRAMEQMNTVNYPTGDKQLDQPRTTSPLSYEQNNDKKKDHPHHKDKNQKGGHPDDQRHSSNKEEDGKPTKDAHKSGNSETWKGKCHVLLVDDNKINLNLLTMFMKKCGFSYEEADNGEEAVETFKKSTIGDAKPSDPIKKRFDYILMDISMPVMNGVEATKRIRKLEAEYKVPRTTVFALTGLASADARLDAMTAGVDLFLPKPVKFAELKTMIDNN
ncbi:Histidine kinase [Fusarium acuminatum]|uniref:histidine kinase n=1 Tax=Fusarium acuminatum TaxID=5515 RepID=A0ABZ2X7F2_9HYPO